MVKFILVALGAFALGVGMNAVQERTEYRLIMQRQEMGSPIKCDATVEQRTKPNKPFTHACYIAGMHK